MRPFLSRMVFCCLVLIEIQVVASAQTSATPPSPVPVQIENLPQNGPAAKSQPSALTLAEAEARALKNQPRLLAAQLRAQAAGKRITESRSAYFPQAVANLTAVQANGDSAVAAGAITTSSISTRAAGGASLVQMITDFGHTSNRVQSARFEAKAADQDQGSPGR